ncbi:MAG: phospholipid carrier-dependent glycosyltransferase, partial [Oscillospiraceae bacterium]|nr:phospholipid carrier-dependent glycosyltransferase [Oscillospiraceae bacterium]
DYPPGYMYILAAVNGLINLFGIGINSVGAVNLVKLPSILADFGIAYLIYRFGQLKGVGKNKAAFIAFMFLFMPSVIFNSSVWGQIESWFMLFVLLSLCLAHFGRTVPAAICYAVALITKPQALFFGPVLLFYIIRKNSIKELLKAVGTGMGTFYLLTLPFCKSPLSISWLFDLYANTVSGYKYYTVNAFNLYYTLGLNWKELPQSFGFITPLVILAAVILAAFAVFKHKDNDGFFAAAAVIIAIIFAFAPMMHERYLWPCAVLCILAFAVKGQTAYLCFGALFGCMCYINSACAMAMYFGPFHVNEPAAKLAGFATAALVVCFAVFALRTAAKEKGFEAKSLKKLCTPQYATAAVTAVYAFFALLNLGSLKAPQTYFVATAENYSFTVEFDVPTELGSVALYSGLGDQFAAPEGQKLLGQFEIYLSPDGENFVSAGSMDSLSVYSWQSMPLVATEELSTTVKAVRVRAKFVGDVLHEAAFFDTEGHLVKGTLTDAGSTNPFDSVSAYDEQDAVPEDTGFFGSMYFDEIYHGRTAYEQLNGYDIYETTHPPLGKILISLGIALFGMTPFGWRIVGALCGVAMLPIIYLLVNAICKNRWAGCFAAALLAVDFMHLTQTRIATVDTYVVLFMLLTFLFMARYHNTPFGDKKEWLNLALSGVFMGCTIASKWNGAYPMVALAIFFFVSLALKYFAGEKEKADRLYVAATLCLCCVFFVAVPLVIYAASFIPVLHAESFKDFMTQLVSYQQHMYNYHANLEAEHFFSSMWYSWPLNLKPIWYSITENGGMASSISAFGNPLIWIVTPFASLYCLAKGIKDKSAGHLMCGLGYIASYLPWVLVTRLCFIYHYFPCAVFGIAAMAVAANDLCSSKPQLKKAVFVYLAACCVMFVMFLPVTTGMWVPREYLDFLEFLPDWHFVNM